MCHACHYRVEHYATMIANRDRHLAIADHVRGIHGFPRRAPDGRMAGMGSWTKLMLLGVLVMSSGCHSIGPGKVAVDRFDYSSAIADSWKQQTLLNIVK